MARRFNTGLVHVNDVMLGAGQTPVPFGGWNESGVGSRSGGAAGIRKYCRTKSIVANRVEMKKEVNWYPYTARKGKFQAVMTRFVAARDWRRRLGLGARPGYSLDSWPLSSRPMGKWDRENLLEPNPVAG